MLGIFNSVKKVFNRNSKNNKSSNGGRGLRKTVETVNVPNRGTFNSVPRKARRELSLDERLLNRLSVDELIDTLADCHPDVSFAIWNFLRIGNNGYVISVHKPGTIERSAKAEKELGRFLQGLKAPSTKGYQKSRNLDKVIIQLMQSVLTRGAASLEVVLDKSLENVVYLAPVDPASVEFKIEDGRYVPYQGKTSLDIPTFFYEGLDERVGDPYGRSPFLSALSIIMFQLQVLNDIKAVVHSQGYPKMDIVILEEVLLKRMPIQIRNNEAEKQKWMNDRLNEIVQMYNNLEPDDSYVHFDSIQIGTAGGSSAGKGALIDPQKLMSAIDGLIVSGLKTLSTVLGRRTTGNTESFAKIEIKLYLQGVKAVQNVISDILEKAFTLVLNIRGIQGDVVFEFKPAEIRTELEQEQFKQIKFINLAFARDQGWIDQDEASRSAVGHSAFSEPNWDRLQPIKNKEGQTPKGNKESKDGVDDKG